MRNFDLAEFAHLFLTRLLLVEQLALTRNIAAVALGNHVLAHRSDRLARDDLRSDSRLHRNLEQMRLDQLFQLFAHRAATAFGARTVHDNRQRIDRLGIDEDGQLDQIALFIT